MDSEVHMFAIMDWISQHYGFIERRCWFFAKILVLLTERTGTISPILVQIIKRYAKEIKHSFKLLIYLPKHPSLSLLYPGANIHPVGLKIWR